MKKTCTKCNQEKLLCYFHRSKDGKYGRQSRCIKCYGIYSREYYNVNRDILSKKRRDNYNLNPEKEMQRIYDWRIKKYGDKKKERKEKKELKERLAMIKRCEREYHKRYLQPVKMNLRARLNVCLKKTKSTKDKSVLDIIGCDIDELRTHIEKQFVKGMTWDNNNLNGWHIDHIMPLASEGTKDGIEKLFHYTNLQPLWAKDNRLKKDKIPLISRVYFTT